MGSRLPSSEWSVTAGAFIAANIEALLADCLLFVRTLARRICRTKSGYVLANRGRHYPAFGTQISTPEGTSNIVGMIPITVKDCRFKCMVLPIIRGSPFNRCCQKR
jgi:hypothetical protein